jgi:hypothetical protein
MEVVNAAKNPIEDILFDLISIVYAGNIEKKESRRMEPVHGQTGEPQ